MKKIVTIGGGTGSSVLLAGLRDIENINISAVVAMTDDGGSTGVLRDELGVLPAGDVRQCLVALSQDSETLRRLMTYRFEEGALSGHNFGNIFLAGLEKVTGSFVRGVEEAGKVLNIKGRVIPVIDKKASLHARLKDGTELHGENEINHADFENIGIEKLYINSGAVLNDAAREVIMNADYVFIGPGNQYCSILPALAVAGMSRALKETKAKLIYITNLTNKKGHNMFFKLSDYVSEIESYIDKKLDLILVNSIPPTDVQRIYYELHEGDGIMIADDLQEDERVIRCDLLSQSINVQNKSDAIAATRSFIRHDSFKLKDVIIEILNSK